MYSMTTTKKTLIEIFFGTQRLTELISFFEFLAIKKVTVFISSSGSFDIIKAMLDLTGLTKYIAGVHSRSDTCRFHWIEKNESFIKLPNADSNGQIISQYIDLSDSKSKNKNSQVQVISQLADLSSVDSKSQFISLLAKKFKYKIIFAEDDQTAYDPFKKTDEISNFAMTNLEDTSSEIRILECSV